MAILTPPRPSRVDRPLVLGLVIQLIIVSAGLGWGISNSLGPSSQPAHQTVVGTQGNALPQPGRPLSTKTTNARSCERDLNWSYTYPTPYLGEVYVEVSANPTGSVPADVTLTWGPWRWQRVVTIRPGLVQFGQGGTLFFYTKLVTAGRTGINPPIYLNASVPVCAYFGTAMNGTPAAMTAINANPGWVHW